MKFDLVVKNGRVVTPSGIFDADIAIKDGIIAAIFTASSDCDSEQTIDAAGRYILPAVVDAHVHFNDPGLPEREDMTTGSSAAAAGGVGTIIDMPLSGNPAVTSQESLELKKRAAQERAVVDYALWAGLVNDNVSQMKDLAEAGAVAFKAFSCFAGNDFPYATPEILYKGMQEAARRNFLIGVHCEDEALTAYLEAEARGRNDFTVRAFLNAHSPLTEELATDTVLGMAKETGARVHICHATLPQVVDKVVRARREGANVTVETCPHYLIFTEEDLEVQRGFLKCTPPVRTPEALEQMWARVFDGSIDLIGSDHSPSTLSQKNPQSGNFWDAWGGVQGVQTMLPALFSEGVLKRGLPLERLMELISTHPARVFGLYPRKGIIQVGSDADLVVFNPTKQWTVTPEILYYKNKHTPYMGMNFTGCVDATLVRGRVVFKDGKVEKAKDSGKFMRRGSAV